MAPGAQALEFQYTNPFTEGPQAGVARGLRISGQVMQGDTARLIQLFKRKPADAWSALGRVELAISGGDHTEALQLAETLAPLYPYVVATTDCAGPCALVWLSGAWRLVPRGRIGLQKPPAVSTANAVPRPGDAPPAFDVQAARLRSYLVKQGLPSQLYERGYVENSDQVYWLSEEDTNATGTWPPYYFEKLHPKCPKLNESEESFHALRRCAARLVISQKAFALDALLKGVNDPWWNDNKDLFFNAPR
ncbi:MAG TPA: hypothetical protein VE934_15775 [Polaromonas sp.]|uniref:hypothetical protein n=1 Tax=Polaromonas sp. TaxID=1869339 RepID=UPI002D371520|nr:hypothetical protein [Polaromonas sp.]HYW58416.1 hypothetical protein [Polaromonas sp.]